MPEANEKKKWESVNTDLRVMFDILKRWRKRITASFLAMTQSGQQGEKNWRAVIDPK